MPIVHPDGLPPHERAGAMAAVALGIVLAVIDGAIANVALPTFAHAMHASAGETVWVVNAYQLAIVALLLPLASLGERIGYRNVYLPALGVFVAASVGCAASHSLGALIAFRVVQGFGAAGIMSVNGALVRTIFPQAMLGRAVGLVALAVAVSAAAGPTVASAILSVAPWPFLFLVNVPTGLAALALGLKRLPWSERGERPFDVAGASLSALSFVLVFVGVEGVTRGRDAGLILLLAGLGAIAALVWRERAETRPLFPVDLLRIPLFAGSIATSVASFAAQGLTFVALPFLFETVLGRDAVQTGLLITPWPIATACAAPIAGRLSDRLPASVLGGIGLGLLASGLVLLATMSPNAAGAAMSPHAAGAAMPGQVSDAAIAWRMALCGVGFGLFQSPNNRTLLGAAPRRRAGAASGMLATARLTGQTTGASLAAILFRLDGGAGPHLCLVVAASLAGLATGRRRFRLRLAAGSDANDASPAGKQASRPR